MEESKRVIEEILKENGYEGIRSIDWEKKEIVRLISDITQQVYDEIYQYGCGYYWAWYYAKNDFREKILSIFEVESN